MGPAVSWLWLMGMMPVRATRAMVGLMPTRPFMLAGQVTEPEVSVPMVRAARLRAPAAPEPELEPQAVRRGS